MLFSFIDLFSGIGGTRTAFEKVGGTCRFSSENDKFACLTYKSNFNDNPFCDILDTDAESIPPYNILVAGFPCQPFSLAGVVKRNSLNMKHGFQCEDKGQLFFKLVEILRVTQPDAFLFENVKNLISHNEGRTYYSMKKLLEITGYDVHEKVIDGKLLVPQHRERVYIVGFRKDLKIEFDFDNISIPPVYPSISSILENEVDNKYTLSDKLWNYLQEYKKRQKEKGNGFGFGLTDLNKHSRTLSSRYYKDGAEILIPQEGKNPRRLTPRECARLMGFPDTFKIPVSDTQAYKQFGNSVIVPIVEYIAWAMVECLYQKEELAPLMSLFNESKRFSRESLNGGNPIIRLSLGENNELIVSD